MDDLPDYVSRNYLELGKSRPFGESDIHPAHERGWGCIQGDLHQLNNLLNDMRAWERRRSRTPGAHERAKRVRTLREREV